MHMHTLHQKLRELLCLDEKVLCAVIIYFVLLCQTISAQNTAPAEAASDGGSWRLGRATYYGAPQSFAGAFDAARGPGSFGILTEGSCGFTDEPGDILSYPADAVAALADASPDYPGSCGRCYAIRCKSGLVLDNDGAPLLLNSTDFIYLPSVSRTLTDSYGRRWPGNIAEAAGQLYTQCYNESAQVVVRIIDTCPCRQVLPPGAPGVAAGGEVRIQAVCCSGSAGIEHFDLSYYAMEQLTHPLYGQAMLEFRPVDCRTGEPLPFIPGYINRNVIYGPNGIESGWGWQPYGAAYKRLRVPGIGPDGTAAMCVQIAKGGGVPFQVKQGFLPGYEPFNGVTNISFSLRSDATPAHLGRTSTPAGEPVNLKMFLQNDEFGHFCNREIETATDLMPVPQGDGWYQYTVPLEAFRCDYEGAMPADIDRLDFQALSVPGNLPALFCLANLTLEHGPT